MSVHLLEKLLKDKYGIFESVRLTGGYTNQTYYLKGIKPPLVAKVGNGISVSLLNEANCLKLLAGTKIAPEFYEYIETAEARVTLMEYSQGVNGQTILDGNDHATAEKLYVKLAEVLVKDIHSHTFGEFPFEIPLSNMAEMNLDLKFVPEELIHQSRSHINFILESGDDLVLTHGDYGIHNVLYSKDGSLTVLDWEWAEWGNPLSDISWVCWFTQLHYPQYSQKMNDLFLKEYQLHCNFEISAEKLKAFSVYKVWKVLNKIEDAPSNVQNEWVRRLKWTLNDFFRI